MSEKLKAKEDPSKRCSIGELFLSPSMPKTKAHEVLTERIRKLKEYEKVRTPCLIDDTIDPSELKAARDKPEGWESYMDPADYARHRVRLLLYEMGPMIGDLLSAIRVLDGQDPEASAKLIMLEQLEGIASVKKAAKARARELYVDGISKVTAQDITADSGQKLMFSAGITLPRFLADIAIFCKDEAARSLAVDMLLDSLKSSGRAMFSSIMNYVYWTIKDAEEDTQIYAMKGLVRLQEIIREGHIGHMVPLAAEHKISAIRILAVEELARIRDVSGLWDIENTGKYADAKRLATAKLEEMIPERAEERKRRAEGRPSGAIVEMDIPPRYG